MSQVVPKGRILKAKGLTTFRGWGRRWGHTGTQPDSGRRGQGRPLTPRRGKERRQTRTTGQKKVLPSTPGRGAYGVPAVLQPPKTCS